MEDTVGGSRRDESGGGPRREEGPDQTRDGVVAKELKRLRLLVQQGRGLDKQREVEWAAREGHKDVVCFLVEECGADVNIQDYFGWTALMWAARTMSGGTIRGGHIDIVCFLVEECSVAVNIQDKDGWTALMWAAWRRHKDVVRFLVKEGCTDVYVVDKDGSTALTKAAVRGDMDVVRFLVEECGDDVNIQGKDGSTALMEATRGGYMNVVRFLVEECGVDVNLMNDDAHSAIRIASDYGHNDIVRLLTPFAQPTHRSSTHSGDRLQTSDAHRSIEIPPSERNICGEFRVKWLGAQAVVKLFVSEASSTTFEQEVHAWKELHHPNVLKLYGVCQAALNVNFFVCEYASQGSLAEYTMSTSSSSDLKPLTWKFLYEGALGLEYLHERGIIHGDLRCSNILIGNDGVAKLSNFSSTGVATTAAKKKLMKTFAFATFEVQRRARWFDPYIGSLLRS